jgi:TctA family transporter
MTFLNRPISASLLLAAGFLMLTPLVKTIWKNKKQTNERRTL